MITLPGEVDGHRIRVGCDVVPFEDVQDSLAAFGPGGDFLERFKAYGWYLDDLVLRPINDLPRTEKKKACLEAQDSLASRIKEYRPRAIVCLLLGIKPFVKAAAKAAGCNAPFML